MRPDDIASMSILKDAAATAVYGPRAANGVVVIATKRGQEGAPTITLNQKVSIMTPAYRPKGLSSYEYALARNEAELASFQESPTFNDTELSKYYMGDLWQKGYGFEEIRNLVNERYNLGYSLQDINDLFDPLKTQGKISRTTILLTTHGICLIIHSQCIKLMSACVVVANVSNIIQVWDI